MHCRPSRPPDAEETAVLVRQEVASDSDSHWKDHASQLSFSLTRAFFFFTPLNIIAHLKEQILSSPLFRILLLEMHLPLRTPLFNRPSVDSPVSGLPAARENAVDIRTEQEPQRAPRRKLSRFFGNNPQRTSVARDAPSVKSSKTQKAKFGRRALRFFNRCRCRSRHGMHRTSRYESTTADDVPSYNKSDGRLTTQLGRYSISLDE